MTTADRAKQLAEEWHCRDCDWWGEPPHEDDMKVVSEMRALRMGFMGMCDLEHTATEITALLDLLVEARAKLHHANGCAMGCEWECNCGVEALIEKIDKVLKP